MKRASEEFELPTSGRVNPPAKRQSWLSRLIAAFTPDAPDEACTHASEGEMCMDCATDWAIH